MLSLHILFYRPSNSRKTGVNLVALAFRFKPQVYNDGFQIFVYMQVNVQSSS